jgi:hypothetical protein
MLSLEDIVLNYMYIRYRHLCWVPLLHTSRRFPLVELSCEGLCVRLERVVCGSLNWNIQDSERRILRLKHTTNPNAVTKMKEIGLQRDFPRRKCTVNPKVVSDLPCSFFGTQDPTTFSSLTQNETTAIQSETQVQQHDR